MAGLVDYPFKLITTPTYQLAKGQEPNMYHRLASEMACVHNIVVRGINSIYLQAPHVRPEDVKSFLGYAYCFYEATHVHHHGEEETIFPEIERVVGVPGLMAKNVEQHHEFHVGLEEYGSYLKACMDGKETFDGKKLVDIIDRFGKTLTEHLTDEIPTLLQLEEYSKGREAEMAGLEIMFAEQGAKHMKQLSLPGALSWGFFNHDGRLMGQLAGCTRLLDRDGLYELVTPKSPRAAVDFTTSLHAKEAGQDSATLSKPWKSVITGSMLHRLATLLIPAVALAAPSPQAEPPASAVVDCPREWLESMTAAYVAAQRSGAGSAILSLGGYANTSSSVVNVTYTENGNVTDPATSVPAYPLKIDFTRSIHDTVTCRTFTEIIAATDPHPYVIHTRIEFSPPTSNGTEAATGGYPTVIESIVTDDGDWLFNATGTLKINAEEDWGPIVFERRDTRDVIQAVGDAYFDRFGNVSTAPPLWGAPCYRLEGGLKAAGTLEANGSCTMVWPSSIHVPYRRYVIDETLGALSMFVGFPGLDRTQGQAPMPDSHFFRVEHGVLRYLHTASACVVAGCGL